MLQRRALLIVLTALASGGCGLSIRESSMPGRLRRIGILSASDPQTSHPQWAAFADALQALGWIEGHNLTIDWRFAPDQRNDLLPDLAAELTRIPVDVIVASATQATLTAKQQTTTLPIVMADTCSEPLFLT
jgi:putative ABC transport system substrate-binding protein